MTTLIIYTLSLLSWHSKTIVKNLVKQLKFLKSSSTVSSTEKHGFKSPYKSLENFTTYAHVIFVIHVFTYHSCESLVSDLQLFLFFWGFWAVSSFRSSAKYKISMCLMTMEVYRDRQIHEHRLLLFLVWQIGCVNTFHYTTSHVLCKHSNGERASLANLKLTLGSLLA